MANETIVCVASGPSLTVADCALIERSGLKTIAVNTSWERARFADYIYAGDLSWWERNYHKIDIDAIKVTCAQRAAGRYRLLYHRRHGAYNSGMRAIQFAIKLGAKKIILLGYDCSVENGTHWHDDHEHKNPTASKTRIWLGQFRQVADEAKKANVEIINCSRHTALKCFPQGELHDYVRYV